MTETIIVFARITPKPQFYSQAEESLKVVISLALEELGCLVLNLYKGTEDNSLYVYEVWKNEEAHIYHREQEYTKELLNNFKEWLVGPIEIFELSQIL